jgi:hypothetical protein
LHWAQICLKLALLVLYGHINFSYRDKRVNLAYVTIPDIHWGK